ncbi:MAG TPA: hypothetical protein VF111_12985, partial [Thermoanaerobaculia bacterium]
MTPRKRLGGWSTALGRNAVYQLPDAVEVESSQIFNVVRQRVFFDEVTMVTLHRDPTPSFLIVTGLYSLFFGMIAVILGISGSTIAAWIFGGIALPGAIAFVVRAILGVSVVTVIGKRSRAAIRYKLRQKRAREVFEELNAAVFATHQRLAREYAAMAPPAAAT